jgi:transcriptional regulator with XRE-family HTH domain
MRRDVLRKARNDKGMTQQQIADYLPVSLRYYKQIEAGQRTGDYTLWDKLEDLFAIHQRILREIAKTHLAPVNSQ